MEGLVTTGGKNWRDCRVFLTGHTGFKGSWLALFLHRMGAKVHGFSLPGSVQPCLFESAGVARTLSGDTRGDLADRTALEKALQASEPEVVFHLAAQPLVRAAYRDPVGTFATNVMGTVHLLDAVRRCPTVRAVVVVTTDKVYANPGATRERRRFVESDLLGGSDPYSAGKAAAEIATAAWRESFFPPASASKVCIATVRAGNVIGGGDWTAQRLVPDCLSAFAAGEPVRLRYPASVRPWQHVLDPLRGYVSLAAGLCGPEGQQHATAWNFGPDLASHATVLSVAQRIAALWPGAAQVVVEEDATQPHESGFLALDSSRAHERLGWQSAMNLDTALEATMAWHRKWLQGEDMHRATLEDIEAHLDSPSHE